MSSPAESEGRLRDLLARANIPDDQIAHQLSAVRPRLGADGRYRRSGGEHIGVEAVASLLLASEAAKHAPQPLTATETDLAAMKARFVALRASQAEQPRTVDQVLARMSNPLDAITPGR